jgi:tRNA(Met) C34 N-acetyltransferase TmcA
MVDYHLITDLLPVLARLYFLGRLPQVNTSYLQAAILLGLGLQHRYAILVRADHIIIITEHIMMYTLQTLVNHYPST